MHRILQLKQVCGRQWDVPGMRARMSDVQWANCEQLHELPCAHTAPVARRVHRIVPRRLLCGQWLYVCGV